MATKAQLTQLYQELTNERVSAGIIKRDLIGKLYKVRQDRCPGV